MYLQNSTNFLINAKFDKIKIWLVNVDDISYHWIKIISLIYMNFVNIHLKKNLSGIICLIFKLKRQYFKFIK